jgi:hypothetical protein
VSDEARLGARAEQDLAQHQAAPVSSEVAEVAKRPKKRPGNRERSSITMGSTFRPAVLV